MTSIPTRKIEMKTAIELAARLSARYLDTKQMLPDELAHESAAMILQQAEQIEALTKMLVISDDTHQTWMKENSPGGWIDDLRKENKALLKANLDCIDHFNALKADYDALKADAERYRWLKDNRSYAYAMQPDSPAECGIEFQWQQCSYEERNWNIDSAIDDEISRAAIDAMKGAT